MVKKTDLATKTTIIGLLVHYSYAVILFLASDLTKNLAFPMSVLYLAATVIPLVLVCHAALGQKVSSSLKDLEPRQSLEET